MDSAQEGKDMNNPALWFYLAGSICFAVGTILTMLKA